MKNWSLRLAIAACSLWATMASAQSFVLDWQDPPKAALPDDGLVQSEGSFRNTASKPISILFKTDFTNVVAEHSMRICFGDYCYICYPDSYPEDRDPFVMPGNSSEKLKAQCVPNGVAGNSTIIYTLFDRDNPTDTMRYGVTFLVGTSSVRDAQELAVTVSPNPSSEVITVTGDATASIIAYNLYTADGRLRRTFPVTNDGVARLDVSDLSAGTYHLMLTVPGGDVYRQAVSIIR
jgi:hypothetical protein